MKRAVITTVAVVLVSAAVVSCGEVIPGGSASTPTPRSPRPTRTVTPTPAVPDGPAGVYTHTGPRDLDPSLADVPSRVYVPNSKSNTVSVIDPASMEIVDRFSVGGLPQHVTPSWDMKTLYVNNNQGNTLTPIDPRTSKPGDAFAVEDPYNLYFSPDGKLAIVIAERLRRVDIRDPRSWELIKSIAIPHKGPNHIDFSPDGSYFLISCEFSGYVVKVDLSKMEVAGDVHVGGKPADVRVSPDGSVFFIANEHRSGVSVIDPVKMEEVEHITTGNGAHGFVVSRDGTRLYVANRAGGSVSVLDMKTRRVVATWETGGSPDMGGVTTDGTRLWLSERYHGRVMVLDTKTGSVIKRIATGAEPHGLCVFPQPGRYSLGHTGNYR